MKNISKYQFVLIWFLIIFSFFALAINSQSAIQYTTQEDEEDEEDDDDDDGDDLSKALGLTAIILFGVVISKALIFFIFKFTRKLDDTKESNITFKKNMKIFFMKTRKPLQWIHYIAGSTALILLFIHGFLLRTKSLPRTIQGILTAIILTFYVFSGIIAKFKLFKESKKFKKLINTIHRNFPFFIFIIIFHLIHLALED